MTIWKILFAAVLGVVVIAALFGLYGPHRTRNVISQKGSIQYSLLRRNDHLSLGGSDEDVCLTPGCVEAAARLLSSIDETVDPCTDFYRFACGGWMDKNTIPEDKSAENIMSQMRDQLQTQLKDLFEQPLTGNEPNFVPMLKMLYDSCMDTDAIEKAGSNPLKRDLSELGGWPVVEGYNWSEENFDWLEMLLKFRKMGHPYGIFLQFTIQQDLKNNKVNKINVDESQLGVPDRSYILNGLDNPVTAAYFKLMVKSAILLGADENTAESELLKALQFEKAIANITLPKDQTMDFTKFYNKFTVKSLQNNYPEISWLKWLNGIFKDEIDEDEILIVSDPDFIYKLSYLISNTDKRVLANYMVWRVVLSKMFALSEEWRALYNEYISVITGQTKETSRWENCVNMVNDELSIAVSSYYVRYHFKKESKHAALEMVHYIMDEFKNILRDITWMDAETKKQAKAKADSFKTYIGYPEEILNDAAVMTMFEDLSIQDTSFYDNEINLIRWKIDFQNSNLRKPNTEEDKWLQHGKSASVNAYYAPLENSIEFCAGILQKPFFDSDRPQYMNFGATGLTIGHEITHGFDNTGRTFDKDGNMVNWWDETTDKKFKEKAQCMIEQYSNYTAENGMKLNGFLTQNENIADNGGIKEAYYAYKSWVKKNGEEKRLPGLDYTQNQLFWISSATSWCSKERPEYLRNLITSDPHSINSFRVIGMMSNAPDFSREFHCPPNSPMNRENKCEVW